MTQRDYSEIDVESPKDGHRETLHIRAVSHSRGTRERVSQETLDKLSGQTVHIGSRTWLVLGGRA